MDQCCILCGKQLEESEQSIKIFLFAQTFGMRPRLKSKAEYICFCPTCGASLAFGPAPEGALYQAAYRRLRELIGADNTVAQLAWQKLNTAMTPPMLVANVGDRRSSGVIELGFGEAARAS